MDGGVSRWRRYDARRMSARLVTALVVVSLLVASAVAYAAGAGTYRGTLTKGANKVQLTVKNNRVTKFSASIYASCGSSNFNITIAYPPSGSKGKSAKISGGRFSATFQGDPSLDPADDKRTISGKFTGAKVAGKIKVSGLCSAEGTYTAKR